MRIARWMPKVTNTHSEYVIHIDFPPHCYVIHTLLVLFQWPYTQTRSSSASLYRFLDHTLLGAHPVVLPWTGDQPVVGAATYTTYNKHQRRTFCASSGIRNHILSIRATLDGTAVGISTSLINILEIALLSKCVYSGGLVNVRCTDSIYVTAVFVFVSGFSPQYDEIIICPSTNVYYYYTNIFTNKSCKFTLK
jgi:hypothetical protein